MSEFKNVKQLAQLINETLKTVNKKYTLRPFNRFNVERSMWWLIPSKDFPAYQFGKYFVVENKSGTYTVGIHIEKGYEKALDYKENMILNSNWIWNDFIKAVADGEISEVLKEVNNKIEGRAGIGINIEIPEIDLSRKLVFNGYQFKEYGTDILTDLESIPQWIRKIDGIEWYWVDFYVCYTIQKDWSVYEIVESLLAPLEKWII